MIVTEALSRLKEKIVQRVNGCGQEIFINKVLLGEQYLTCENVFAGKPKCRLYPFSLLGHHLTFFTSLAQKPFWYYSGRVFMLQTNKEFSQKIYGGTTTLLLLTLLSAGDGLTEDLFQIDSTHLNP